MQAKATFDLWTSTGETSYFHFRISTLLVSTFLVTELNQEFTEGTNFADCLTKVSPLNQQTTVLEITK